MISARGGDCVPIFVTGRNKPELSENSAGVKRGCSACVFVLISWWQRSLAHNVRLMKARSTAADPYQFLPQVFCIVLGGFPSVPSRFV